MKRSLLDFFFHMLHVNHTHATIRVVEKKKGKEENDILTLLNAFTFSYDVNLCCVLCAVETDHAYAPSLYPLGSAALLPAGSNAVSHFDHLVGATSIFF